MTKVLALSLVLASQGISPPVPPEGRRIAGWSCAVAGLLLGGISGTALVFEAGYEYGGPRRAGLYLSAVGLGLGIAAIVTGITTVWLSAQGGGVGVRLSL